VHGVFAGEVVAKFPAQLLLLLPVAPGVRPTLCSLSLSVLTIDNISNSHPPASSAAQHASTCSAATGFFCRDELGATTVVCWGVKLNVVAGECL